MSGQLGWSGFWLVSGAALATVTVAMVLTAWVARRTGRVSVVDVTWGLLFVAIAWVSAAVGSGDPGRRLLLAALVTLWGGRLAWHIHRRARGAGEDPRYAAMLADAPEGRRFGYAVRRVFVVQGASAWFVSLPIQVAAVTSSPASWVVVVGVAIWLVGIGLETVGDAQLAAYKRDPANRGTVMDRGLWGWTRHPNYFGDACVWWGIWVIAAAAWPGVLTILSPGAMTYFLAFATGARLLESEMAKRPGYPAYMERTSGFVPWPPRRA